MSHVPASAKGPAVAVVGCPRRGARTSASERAPTSQDVDQFCQYQLISVGLGPLEKAIGALLLITGMSNRADATIRYARMYSLS